MAVLDLARQSIVACLFNDGHPAFDELSLLIAFSALAQETDTTAMGVAENDDVLNIEVTHRELDSRAGAVVPW